MKKQLLTLALIAAAGTTAQARFTHDPFASLFSDDIESIFGSMPVRSVSYQQQRGDDISHDDEHYYIDIAMPGMKKDDLKINFDRQTRQLSVSATSKSSNNEESEGSDKSGRTWISRSSFSSSHSFSRAFNLPKDAKVESSSDIKAKLEDGVLHLTIDRISGEAPENERFFGVEVE